MFLIVGLGNPGEKYKNSRHNAGFSVVEDFRGKNNFPEFKLSKKFNSEISEGVFNNEKIILAKPQTFMNDSGKAARKLVSSFKFHLIAKQLQGAKRLVRASSFIVIHDDIDLPFGEIKIVKNRGSAGHNGVESIIKNLGTKDFARIRIGILPVSGKPKNPKDFVIKNFNKEEKENFEKNLEKTSNAIESFISQGLERTMSEFNQ